MGSKDGHVLPDVSPSLFTLAIGPNKEVISGSVDGRIKFWNMETGECVRTLSKEKAVFSLVMSPCGSQLLAGSDQGCIEVFH